MRRASRRGHRSVLLLVLALFGFSLVLARFTHEAPRASCRDTAVTSLGPSTGAIFVGLGAANAFAARRFLNLTNCSVPITIIEAGQDVQNEASVQIPFQTGSNVNLPSFTVRPGFNPATDWNFRTRVTDDAINPVNRTAAYPRAHSVGGCTSHHEMVWFSPTDVDFERWVNLTDGNTRWSPAVMREIFKSIENNTYYGPLDPEHHGTAGPIAIVRGIQNSSYFYDELCVAAALHVGNVVMGMPLTGNGGNLDPNGDQQYREGIGQWQRTVYPGDYEQPILQGGRSGFRSYPGNAHLPLLLSSQCPSGVVTLLDNTLVTKVIMRGTRAIGVEYLAGSNGNDYAVDPRYNATASAAKLLLPRHKLYAEHGVVLGGGFLNTPQLMELTGVGDPTVLQAAGIEVVKELPGVGNGMQDHPEVTTQFELPPLGVVFHPLFSSAFSTEIAPDYCTPPTPFCYCNPLLGPEDPCLKQYLAEGRGYYTTNHVLMGFNTFSGDLGRELSPQGGDCHTHFINGIDFKNWDTPSGVNPFLMTVLTEINHAETRGSVHIRSSNPLQPPVIDARYGTHRRDMARLANCTRIARTLMLDPAWQDIFTFDTITETNATAGLVTDEQLIQYISAETYGHHGACTARMGSIHDRMAVADGFGRVFGTQNLYVGDMAAAPELGNGNPQSQAMMIGDQTGAYLAQRVLAESVCNSNDEAWILRTPVLDTDTGAPEPTPTAVPVPTVHASPVPAGTPPQPKASTPTGTTSGSGNGSNVTIVTVEAPISSLLWGTSIASIVILGLLVLLAGTWLWMYLYGASGSVASGRRGSLSNTRNRYV